ncbi:MAG TPA: hypothetical protein VMN57_03475 [Anaerolineales bacterium]|nr:hypothetical protein [Anaerolineales bacterium]
MMDKEALLKLNRVPDGVPAWLDYKAFRKLQQLLEALAPPEETDGLGDEDYIRLHAFLADVAGIEVPETQEAVHLNAFVLLRRGYKAEETTEPEYGRLLELLEGTEEPDPDDLELHDFGAHRALYKYLSEGLGVYVEPGRGPVWRRARQLVEAHEQAKKDEPVPETSHAD